MQLLASLSTVTADVISYAKKSKIAFLRTMRDEAALATDNR
jgi:hypothetical protein